MANKTEKFVENVPGAWYVDKSCIICGMCSEIAPSVFKSTDDFDHNYVHHQPESNAERGLAQEAMESCPADAIGCDDSANLSSKSAENKLDP